PPRRLPFPDDRLQVPDAAAVPGRGRGIRRAATEKPAGIRGMAMTPASSGARVAGAQVKGLNCPGCGGPLTVRGFEHTVTVVCPQCLAILDAKDPNLQILQKFKDKTRVTLLIPLGSRGIWQGTVYEVIGYQRRTTGSGDEAFSWSEYLLFNPYKGFRYFTEYNGHWNDVRTLRALPKPGFVIGAKQRIQYAGTT